MSATPGRKDARRVFESLVLLRAKVQLPPARPPVVERRDLLAELTSSRDTPVVLISGPPGYGKTTLLVQWAEADDRPFAYVHLEDSDNDPSVMLSYITLALETLWEVDSRVKDALRAPEPALGRMVLPGIANDLAERDPFVLVLDDVHALRDETCLRNLAYLSAHVPPGSQLALAGRADPLIPLASLRVERELLEIRTERLVFDEDEAAGLFRRLDLDLDPEAVRRLVEQTEGWPAGLYLAALYLRDCEEPEDHIDRFGGDYRNVADYFMTEVLARQPAEIVEFVRRTSILERLSGPMCDAVLGRRHSGELLAGLERSIPFLMPLDERRRWYRYHNLFAELLVAELYAREPDSVADLHRRAAAWYEAQAFVDETGADTVPEDPGVERLTPKYFESAMRHLLAGGDPEHAGDLLARHWRPYAAAGRLASLRRMLDDFTDDQIAGHPPLALTAAWAAYLQSDGDAAERLLERAEPIDDPVQPEWSEFRSSAALLRAGLALRGVGGMRRDAESAYALESEMPTTWFGLSRIAIGIVCLLEGDAPRAADLLRAASAAGRQYGDVRMLGAAALALCELDAGDWDAARDIAAETFRFARRYSLTGCFPSMLAQAVHARVLAHDGEDARARETIESALRLLGRPAPQWWHASLALLVLVEAMLDIGDAAGAEQRLKTARALVLSREDAGALPSRLARVQAAVGLRLLPEPLSPSELHILEQLPEGGSLSEVAGTIYLSRNTVKTHVRSIYRKLGVTSREEAVDLGRSLGLIR